MKSLLNILFAGAVLASALFGSGFGAEERFRLKYGRNTPLEEARQQAASSQMNCTGHWRFAD
jgi:hypothetical protein